MEKHTRYPLYFGFSELVAGRGFFANVIMNGRVLAEEESEGWWVYGVNPGAIAAGGRSLHDAVAKFRHQTKSVLMDFASEAESFAAFEALIRDFFDTSAPESIRDWDDARAAVRAGKATLTDLSQERADRSCVVSVDELKSAAPDSNKLEETPSLAA